MNILSSGPEIERGDALRDSGAVEEAIALYRQIITADPKTPVARYKLGTALSRLGLDDQAEASYREALKLAPDYPEAANNLGILVAARGNFDEAEILYRNALIENIEYFEAHLNLGDLLKQTARRAEALYHYRRAISLRPTSAIAKAQLGEILFDTGRISEAMAALQRAIDIDPRLSEAWANLARCYLVRGNISQAEHCGEQAISNNPGLIAAWQNLLLTANYYNSDREKVFRKHISFGQHLAKFVGVPNKENFPNTPDPTRRLRVGFLSGDLRRHSVSYFVEGLLRHIDRGKIEIWAYYNHPEHDQRSQELNPLFVEWESTWGISNTDVVSMIRRDRIDVLVDLAGVTGNARLGVFALQPAPIQMSWIGYPNTTGLPMISYRLTDELADPTGQSDQFHCEKLVRLPDSFLCYSPPKEAPAVMPSPIVANGHVTFGSFNAMTKISSETLSLWSEVLTAVPTGRLLLKSVGGFHDRATKDELLNRIALAGIDISRVTLLTPERSLDGHLAMYGKVDICLDTYPYHGTTTTCESLWMGVPVVTLAGDRHAARVGVSLLTNIGLQDLIAASAPEYVRIAAELAADRSRLTVLRSGMRQRMLTSPLLDAAAMACNFERAVREMWATYCENHVLNDASDAVAPDRLMVNLHGGHRITVPADVLGNIATWVTLEQEDWFEDEIRFVRSLCTTEWKALDVGANHGVYALSLASCGATRTWAFEPASEPRLRLRDSIAENRFEDRIEVIPAGLSATPLKANITLETLDGLIWKDIPHDPPIDFVRLGAEAEGVPVLRGGLRFFSGQSPLVMFGYKQGQSVNTELIAAFRSLGYGIYRLLPALDCLVHVPLGTDAALDKTTLNLFACKQDRAAELADASRLIAVDPLENIVLSPTWAEILLTLPALTSVVPKAWQTFDFDNDYGRALTAWCGSRKRELTCASRFQLLTQAIDYFQRALAAEDDHPAVAVLGIRICADIGMRTEALGIAESFLEQMTPDEEFPLDRPLPPAYDVFDSRLVVASLGGFLYQSVVEFLLDRGSYSFAFRDSPDWLIDRGLGSPEHTARLERSALLIWTRKGKSPQLHPDAKVFLHSEDNLNPDLWRKLVPQLAVAAENVRMAAVNAATKIAELNRDGRPAEALACAEQALLKMPDFAPLLTVTADAAKLLGDAGKAESLLHAAISAQPDYAEAYNDLGILLKETKRFEPAETAFRRAIEIRGGYVEALNNLGLLLMETKRYGEAEAAYQGALNAQPDIAEVHMNLGVLLKETYRFSDAEKSYRRALELRPDMGNAASEAYYCASQVCDWSVREADENRLVTLIGNDAADVSPFVLLPLQATGDEGPCALQLRAGRNYAENEYRLKLVPTVVDESNRPKHGRLRIGYLSADFHEHPTMHLLRGVLAAHDGKAIHVSCYSTGAISDVSTQQARSSCEVFRNVSSLSDRATAELIAADGIDILIDLKGYTQNSRLEITALRPAPVIVSWLGYPATLGHSRLADYIIGDPVVTPIEHAGVFSETLALMPHCYQPNDRERAIGPRPSRQAAGLPDSGFVFCCFNNSYKFNPQTFGLWCRLLAEIPGSVLWLLEPTAPAIANLRHEAVAQGIKADRLVFAPLKSLPEHLGRLQLADIALDTFPYTSHTTASDALWAGVPLVTRIGETFASRVAASLLTSVGMQELVTQTPDDYYALAKALALNPDRLQTLRKTLAVNRLSAPLFDTARFTRNLERLYMRIWEQHGRGSKEIIVLESDH